MVREQQSDQSYHSDGGVRCALAQLCLGEPSVVLGVGVDMSSVAKWMFETMVVLVVLSATMCASPSHNVYLLLYCDIHCIVWHQNVRMLWTDVALVVEGR